MAITGVFGTTMDLERGTSRQWVMGRDGVKRWADNGEPVQKPATTLQHDVARCVGVGSDEEGWREGCDDCLRRTAILPKGWAAWVEPPAIIAFECEFRIEPQNTALTGRAHEGESE